MPACFLSMFFRTCTPLAQVDAESAFFGSERTIPSSWLTQVLAVKKLTTDMKTTRGMRRCTAKNSARRIKAGAQIRPRMIASGHGHEHGRWQRSAGPYEYTLGAYIERIIMGDVKKQGCIIDDRSVRV